MDFTVAACPRLLLIKSVFDFVEHYLNIPAHALEVS
jgi:hypothetical protein